MRSDEYDINVENMLDMTSAQATNGFTLFNSDFYNMKSILVKKKILQKDGDGIFSQIFSMTDGKFILEVDIAMKIEYFYSNNLDDLI